MDSKWGSNQWVDSGLAIISSGQANAEIRTDGGAPALTCLHEAPIVALDRVRRLIPTECERLQGFPDGYTAIPKAGDAPRYKALGNSMAVNVMRWIGQRIAMVDAISKEAA